MPKDKYNITTKEFDADTGNFIKYPSVYTVIVSKKNGFPICNYLPNTTYNDWEIVQDDNFHAQLITEDNMQNMYVRIKYTDDIDNKIKDDTRIYYAFYEKLIEFVNKVKTDKNLKAVNIYWYYNTRLKLDKDSYDSIIKLYNTDTLYLESNNSNNIASATINKEFAYINENIRIGTEYKASESYYLPNYYKLKNDNTIPNRNEFTIMGKKSIIVANNFDKLSIGTNDTIIDKLKMDISYDVTFQYNNRTSNKNEVTLVLGKYLYTNVPFKELYLYCSTATTENKLTFKNSVAYSSTFKNNCTKVYLPVQDVVDVESVAKLSLPDTVEVIYSIPIGATCYTDLPIKYDL